MLQTVALSQIKSRADTIGVSLKVLAKEAGMDPSALYRAAKPGAEHLASTPARILKVLEPREKAILASLARLYPALAIQAANGQQNLPDSRQTDLEDFTRAQPAVAGRNGEGAP